ncbi:MAG: tetratricopeptide repeat protein, partial [Fimbriimonadaceae bacterium]
FVMNLVGNAYDTAATQWRQLAEVHRDSPRAESALIMAARSLLGEAYRETVDWNHPVEEPLEIIDDLLSRYPNTRFRDNALGWRARAYHLQNNDNQANQIYFELLERAEDPDWKWTLHGSLAETTRFQYMGGEDVYHRLHQLALPVSLEKKLGVIHKLNQRFRWIQLQEAVALQERLLGDPVALASYLEFRLNYTYLTPFDFKQLMFLAEEAYDQAGADMLNAQVLARMAETAYMDADAEKADKYAREALAKPDEEGKDLALYILGSSARLSGETGEAEQHYREMIESYPDSHLVGAAKENLALVHEAQGDYQEALDVYFDLGYDLDVAYLVDAYLSLDQLERYIEQRPAHPQFDVLVYSLGMRLMREERFEDSLSTFERIAEDRLLEIGRVGEEFGFWNSDPELDIIRDPRQTARDLQELHEQVESAPNDGAKADALYELASYHYELRNLLLYNPALWQGSRSFSFGYFFNPNVAGERGVESVVEHHQKHEDIYQTLQICQRIAEEYPNTEAAPKALYRGACAARRLAEFNPWWREYDAQNDLYGLAVEMMETLVDRYPDSFLAPDAEKYAEVFAEEREMIRRYRVFDAEI